MGTGEGGGGGGSWLAEVLAHFITNMGFRCVCVLTQLYVGGGEEGKREDM